MSIFIKFKWVHKWLWVFGKAIWQYATRSIKRFIYYTSQASRTSMKITECGIYYRNRPYTIVGKAGEVKPIWGFENQGKNHSPDFEPWGGWTKQSKSKTLGWTCKGGFGLVRRSLGDHCLQLSSARLWVAGLGHCPSAGPAHRKKGSVPREERGQPGNHWAYWQQRPSKSRQGCCLTSAAQTSYEFLFSPTLRLLLQGKEFWVI